MGTEIDLARQALEQAFASRRKRFEEEPPMSDPSLPQTPQEQLMAGPVGQENPLLQATFNTSLNKFLAALGGKASVSSGKRSHDRQAQLWAEALQKYGSPEAARKWVAPPGHSKHELGLAADLHFSDDKTRAEAHNIAKQYGLYFPMANEPWQVQPLGT